MGGHGLHAVQLAGVLLPSLLQHGKVVPAPTHAAHLLGADGGKRGKWPRSPEVTAQPEKGDIHSKSAENNSADKFDGYLKPCQAKTGPLR